MKRARFTGSPERLTFEPHQLARRIVAALEEYLAGSGVGIAGCRRVRGQLHSLVRGVMEDAAVQSIATRSREVTVLLSDIRGFTTIAETHPLPRVAETLNRYFSAMCDVIYRHGGTVDKFMGDSIRALFGARTRSRAAVESAVCCAIEMQLAMEAFNQANQEAGLPPLHMGIGINTGEVLVGRIGSERHSEYTVIGSEVNLASRIEACCVGGQILISESCLERLRPGLLRVSDAIHVSVKGRHDPLRLYEVVAMGPPWNLEAPERDVRRSPRARIEIPFRFQICEGKVVVDERQQGTIRDISIGGMHATTAAEVQPHLNVKFRLRHAALGLGTGDIYGKILNVRERGEVRSVHLEFVSIAPEDRQAIDAMVKAAIAGPFETTPIEIGPVANEATHREASNSLAPAS
jgi:adenylate cyclase